MAHKVAHADDSFPLWPRLVAAHRLAGQTRDLQETKHEDATGRRDVRADMIARGGGDAAWRDGRTAVYVFNAGEDVSRIQHEAYGLYMAENGLGPLAFPSLAQMEKDVIDMGLDLLHGPDGATGAMTSGGTDSITMAIKTARDYARAKGTPREGPSRLRQGGPPDGYRDPPRAAEDGWLV